MTDGVCSRQLVIRDLQRRSGYIARRWPAAAGLVDLEKAMLPVPGTREPLAFSGLVGHKNKSGGVNR